MINGTFFEFLHHNEKETTWNHQAAQFTDEMWAEKVDEMAEIGIEDLVITFVALNYKTFYPSRIFPKWDIKAQDPLYAVLHAAERNKMRVFVGAGFYGNWTNPWEAFTDMEVRRRTEEAIQELAENYGDFRSFYGFYWPNELGIGPDGHFPQVFIDHVRECNGFAKRYLPKAKTLIAPYGTNMAIPDDLFVSQLKEMGIDLVAYQDEIGARKTKIEQLPQIFSGLKEAHRKADIPLWVDMEIYEFEGEILVSKLLPGDFARIEKQIEALSPIVDRILVYQYQGIMNKPSTKVFTGVKESEKLYSDYVAKFNPASRQKFSKFPNRPV